ncbi:hypothetical protein [Lysobacter silvisoli]|uniref:hypothetical protein n=1 Tax=Lysobacter silvisoli TaxID=2293254 RepID=UPI001314532C|nr:hypothetical protein [Lysobacter silvisoli]
MERKALAIGIDGILTGVALLLAPCEDAPRGGGRMGAAAAACAGSGIEPAL